MSKENAAGSTARRRRVVTSVACAGVAAVGLMMALGAPSRTGDTVPFVASTDCEGGSAVVSHGDVGVTWACSRARVDGQLLSIEFDRTVRVTSLTATPLDDDTRRATRVMWRFGGQQVVQSLNASRTLTLPDGVDTDSLSLTVLATAG